MQFSAYLFMPYTHPSHVNLFDPSEISLRAVQFMKLVIMQIALAFSNFSLSPNIFLCALHPFTLTFHPNLFFALNMSNSVLETCITGRFSGIEHYI
jgi:hypothetical protein